MSEDDQAVWLENQPDFIDGQGNGHTIKCEPVPSCVAKRQMETYALMAKKQEAKQPSNYPTETRVKRQEFWLTPEANDILGQVDGSKAEFINRAIVSYWEVTDGATVPLVSDETIGKIAKAVAKAVKKELEI